MTNIERAAWAVALFATLTFSVSISNAVATRKMNLLAQDAFEHQTKRIVALEDQDKRFDRACAKHLDVTSSMFEMMSNMVSRYYLAFHNVGLALDRPDLARSLSESVKIEIPESWPKDD